ncbi:uncharacterized protein [Palaemon carinicauda]|uniref:uncharacterized protein n=1 Tax=Palaemon carinicauda TaxID=392227 RepID=UPI0035B5F914
MASPVSHIIPSDGLSNFRYYYFIRCWGKKVVLLIFKYAFLHGNSKTIHEILTENDVPLGKKGPFSPHEITNLSTKSPECMDITLLNKICQALWDRNVNCPSDKMRSFLRKIKNERNNVSHEESNVTRTELNQKLGNCADMLKETLDEAKILYPAHVKEIDDLETEIFKVIPELKEKIREKHDPTNPGDMERLKSEIKEFGDQLREYVLEKSRGELTALYKVVCRILPFDWLDQYGVVEPCEFMVSLKVDTVKEFHGDFSNNEFTTLDQRELLSKKTENGEDPDVVILSGDAGSGKTTILSSTVEKWYKETNDMPNLSSFQILLYMQFRKRDHNNFDDYLRDLLHGTVLDLGFEVAKSAVLRSRCLFLCDGYDEANSESKKLFEEILQLKCSGKKIIVTTRPVNSKELTSHVNRSQFTRINLSILGLRNEDMESHIQSITKYLIKDVNKRDKMTREITLVFKEINIEMNDILKNPLRFNLFSLLYIECPSLRGKIETVSALYNELKNHLKSRVISKLAVEENVVDDFQRLYRQMSLQYHLLEKYELFEDDVKVFEAKCRELNLCFKTIMSSYFNIKYSRKELALVRIYCYKHRSEQEFEAANAICDNVIRIYRNNRGKFESLVAKRKLIEHVLMVHITEFQNVTQGKKKSDNPKFGKSVESALDGLMIFITGILYNTERDILYLVIYEILNFVSRISSSPTMHSVLHQQGDLIIKHQIETRNDDQVIDAIVDSLKSKQLNVNSPATLCGLPSLLPKLKPVSLFLKVHYNPNDQPYFIPAIESARGNVKYLHLHLLHESFIGNSLKECLDLVPFYHLKITGKFTEKGIAALPKSTKSIEVRMTLDLLQEFSVSLEEVQCLELLGLHIFCVDSINLDCLTPLRCPAQRTSLEFYTYLDLNVVPNVETIAKLLNSIWPENYEHLINATIYSKTSKITGKAVRLLCESLSIAPVDFLRLHNTDCEKEKKELGEFFKSRHNGNLDFF